MMRTAASSGGRSATTGSIIAKKPKPLTVPLRELSDVECLAAGLRQEMLTLGDGAGDVTSGGGCGTDFVILRWGKRHAMVRGSELLRAWVSTFAPEDAEQFPEEIKSV